MQCYTLRTDALDWSLFAHRCGTLRGMDAAQEPTRTYLRGVLRWWTGKGLAARQQIDRSTIDLSTPVTSRHRTAALQ
ncbi:hypothetical protein XmelCFBP4644_06605 [Xanthomonas melonis]|uniref:Uncharacterized protein n=1 Tax=Xanthomonas melonis TaxID=56456 RepID=A0A2S7DJZ7_9XANT|nr:hypothetical protein XmelCFBP4644_06605 [Xanthomonas melonis]